MMSKPDAPLTPDPSNGYEAAATDFMVRRSRIGVAEVLAWARTLRPGASVLDLGCGHGVPVTETLLSAGCDVYALDASPTLVAALHEQFPDVPLACEAVETSSFFNRTFDGIIAWGLLFLLTPDAQRQVIARVAPALAADGTFVFTAPAEPCTWTDVLTRRPSTSLGAATYRELLSQQGLVVRRECDDSGDNHYYVTGRPGSHM